MDAKKYQIRTLNYHRRRSQKTNYVKRLNALKSYKTRLVIRVTSNLATVQLVDYDDDGDKVLMTIKSSELKNHGWTHNPASLPGLYLTGMLVAKKVKDKGLSFEDVIADFGVKKFSAKTKPYALLKGAIDNGLNVLADAKMFPSDDRISGQHIQDFAAKSNEVNKFQFTKRKANTIVNDFNTLKSKLTA